MSKEIQQGVGLTHTLAAAFLAVSIFFVWRSFYAMRIGKASHDTQ